MRRATFVLGLVSLLLSGPAHAFGGYDVYLLTMSPGEDLFTRFGHNAILVRNRSDGRDRVYNFGSFRGSPDLLAKYLSRRLKYFLSVSDLTRTLRNYSGRTIWAQKLDLPAAAVDELVARLVHQARPENREYPYDHFLDNCSTRIRDVLDEVTSGALRRAFTGESSGSSIRKEVEGILGPVPFWRLGVSYILNGSTDRPATRWELQYLPKNLRDDLRQIRIRHPDGTLRPIVSHDERIRFGSLEPIRLLRWPLVLVCLAFLLPLALGTVLGSERFFGRFLSGLLLSLWGLAAALGGGILVFLWTTDIPSWQANGNLLFTSPLHLLLVPLGIILAAGRLSGRGARWLRGILWILLALAVGDLVAHIAGWTQQGHVELGIFSGLMALLGVLCVPNLPEGPAPMRMRGPKAPKRREPRRAEPSV